MMATDKARNLSCAQSGRPEDVRIAARWAKEYP
jgi:hypothetical protein